jgi:hypothetical protein
MSGRADKAGQGRRPKFRVGQVVRIDSGEYGRVTKVWADGTAGEPTLYINVSGRFYEELQASVRPLTERETGR